LVCCSTIVTFKYQRLDAGAPSATRPSNNIENACEAITIAKRLSTVRFCNLLAAVPRRLPRRQSAGFSAPAKPVPRKGM